MSYILGLAANFLLKQIISLLKNKTKKQIVIIIIVT